MLTPDKLGTWRQVLTGDGCQLWAATRTLDQLRFGPTAATGLTLLNTGPVVLHVKTIEVSWLDVAPVCWHRPGLVEPGASWTLLDERSFDALVSLTRQRGRRGFGMEGVAHRMVVQLDQLRPVGLAFEVAWGFATPSYDLGFFLPALGAMGESASPPPEQWLGSDRTGG